jgi:hypothetical protein
VITASAAKLSALGLSLINFARMNGHLEGKKATAAGLRLLSQSPEMEEN